MLTPIQVTDELQAYMESLLPARDPVLRRIEEDADRNGVPIVGPHVGQLLNILVGLARAEDVLELGTATGYSGIWLMRAARGRLITFETDPARARQARANFEAAGLGDRAEVREESAPDGVEGLAGPFGAVFNDLLNQFQDESQIRRAFELSVARLRPGGLLLADNALRRGEVLRPQSQSARNVAEYNRLVAGHPRLRSVIVPVRDGVSVAVFE